MRRPDYPPEIGPLAIYLASPASSYVTGAAFVVGGGSTLWRSAATDLAAPQLDIRQWVSLNFKESGRWPNGGNKQDSGRTGLLRKT